MRFRLIEGAASALAFVAAVIVVGVLQRLGQTNILGLALASTLIVAGAAGVLRISTPLGARFSGSAMGGGRCGF